MNRLYGILGILAILVGVMFFARLNGGESATVHLGVATLHEVPVTFILFGGLVLGMLVMLLAGLHADLKVRRLLRERLAQEERARDPGDSLGSPLHPGVDPLAPTDQGPDDRPEDRTVPDRE